MPIYEYACETCGRRFEKLMKIGAEAPPCAHCGSVEVKKLVSAAAFVLKGGGWYKDHYGLKKGEGGGKSEGASSAGDGGGASTSTATEGSKAAPAATPAPAPATTPKATS